MDDRSHRVARRVQGRSAAPGIALGPLLRLAPAKHDARQHRSVAEEHQALVDALAASQEALGLLAGEAGDADAEAILAFQVALLEDDNLTAPAFTLIAQGEVASRAWSAAIDPEIASYEEASDPYFRARASDLRDLRDRVLRHLAGEAEQIVPSGVIVAADDMPPSMFLATDWRDGGVVLRRGSPSQPRRHSREVAGRTNDRGGGCRSSRGWQGRAARWRRGDFSLSIPTPRCGRSFVSAVPNSPRFGRPVLRCGALHLPRAANGFGS